MRYTLMLLLFCIHSGAWSQVHSVTIQASGLTCSMCSNAINKSLKSLSVVESVKADIKTSSFEVRFKSGSAVDFDQLKKKVEDAGFFVASMEVSIAFNNVSVANDSHLEIDGVLYHFINTGDKTLNGEQSLKILDKGYVSSKEFKKNAAFTKMACYQTGYTGKCCTNSRTSAATRIYHVTIS